MFNSGKHPNKFERTERGKPQNSADRLNMPIEELEIVKRHMALNFGRRGARWPLVSHFLGETHNKEPNGLQSPLYIDPRYQIRRQRIRPKLKVDAPPVPDPEPAPLKRPLLEFIEDKYLEPHNRVITATNLAEIQNGSHYLPEGTTVHVFGALVDLDEKPQTHYFFYREPMILWGVAIADPVDGNNVIELEPCVGPGNATPIGLAPLRCYIVSPHTAKPTGMSFKKGDVLAYVATATARGQLLPVAMNSDPCKGSATPEQHVHSIGSANNKITFTMQRGCNPPTGPFTLLEMEECNTTAPQQAASSFPFI